MWLTRCSHTAERRSSAVRRGCAAWPQWASPGTIATAVAIGHPSWAMVAAAAPLSVRGRDHQALRAGHRIAGTVLGSATSAPLALVLVLVLVEIYPVPLVLASSPCRSPPSSFVARNYGLALLFITLMAVLMG